MKIFFDGSKIKVDEIKKATKNRRKK